MSNIKALEELRGIAERMDDAAAEKSEHGFSPLAISIEHALGKVEEEIAERFILLPVDADGVPIRPGDEVCIDSPTRYVVEAVDDGAVVLDDVFMLPADECRHVKPDTVESLLKDMIKSLAAEYLIYVPDHDKDRIGARMRDIRDEYAERIRKAVEQ